MLVALDVLAAVRLNIAKRTVICLLRLMCLQQYGYKKRMSS